MIKKFVRILSLIVILFSIFIASWFAIHSDIIFHTDIARDFLLLEDVVRNKPITLIGPRSGGIPGVFHGPLWTYLNLPAFLIGNGNPAMVGWFWVVLFTIDVFIIYKIGYLIFSEEVGLLSAAFTAVITASSVPGYFNPFGAVMLTPVFFYFFLQYVKQGKAKDLIISLFSLGLVIQFQMAFGMPILVLTTIFLLIFTAVKKKYSQLVTLLILVIPLSTFILFDLKHNFLQVKSVVNYISGKEVIAGRVDKKISEVINNRTKSIINDGPGFVTRGNSWLKYIFIVLLTVSLYKVFKEKKYQDKRSFYLLFFLFYFGYWLITIPYKGTMWGYYYWPLLPLVSLIFAANYEFIDKRIFIPVIILFILFNVNVERNGLKPTSYFGQDHSSWQFNYQYAKRIFDDAPAEFGYYIFTADQYGYPSRYALNYSQTQYKNKKAYPYEKKTITYLIIFKSNNPSISDDWWKKEQVKIRRAPVKIFQYGHDFRIEKYNLTPAEISEKSDENLIHTLIFR